MSSLKYGYDFDPEDQNNTAAAIFRAARTAGPRVLDLGSGPAIVSRRLHEEHGREVTCVDSDADALESLASSGLRTILADLEADDWEAQLPTGSYDVIILADVLEHLRDPGAMLSRITRGDLLAEGGLLLISVPNAAHESVVAELLLGDFRYTRTGILDATHVRWFTLESLRRLLEQNGFIVATVERTTRTLEQTASFDRALRVPADVRHRLRELNTDCGTSQYIVRARRSDAAGQLAEAREALDSYRAETFRATEAARVSQEQLQARLEQLQARLEQLQARLERAEAERADSERAHTQAMESLSQQHAEALSSVREDLEGRLAAAQAERDRTRDLLNEERANTAHEMELGAAELTAINAEMARLKADLGACRERNRELRRQRAALRETRATQQRKLARYEGSRAISLTSRSVWKLRRVVGKMRGGR